MTCVPIDCLQSRGPGISVGFLIVPTKGDHAMLPLVFNGPIHHVIWRQCWVSVCEEINSSRNIITIVKFIASKWELLLFCPAEHLGHHRPSLPTPAIQLAIGPPWPGKIECYWIVNYQHLCCLPVPS